MSYDYDNTANQERKAEERKKRELKQHREDVQAIGRLPEFRRVLSRFLADVGMDDSPHKPGVSAIDMANKVGQQDAGMWWLAALRSHCPEQEVVMRAETNRALKEAQRQDEEPDANE